MSPCLLKICLASFSQLIVRKAPPATQVAQTPLNSPAQQSNQPNFVAETQVPSHRESNTKSNKITYRNMIFSRTTKDSSCPTIHKIQDLKFCNEGRTWVVRDSTSLFSEKIYPYTFLAATIATNSESLIVRARMWGVREASLAWTG